LDIEKVYRNLKDKSIDAIISYASDIATPTAAIVSKKLGLKSNSVSSVLKLTDKVQFRKTLYDMGLNTPNVWIYEKRTSFKYPETLEKKMIVKPSDSTGTKGVALVENNKEQIDIGIEYALNFSPSKRVLIEEVIDNSQGDVHGDGFIIDGKLRFLYLGDHLYDLKINGLNPAGTTWPSILPSDKLELVEETVNKIIEYVAFESGSINVEARFNSNNDLFIMEIGPRNGGYFVPLAIKYSTGVDLVEATLNQITHEEVYIVENKKNLPVAYYAIHARACGRLNEVLISDWLNERIIQRENIKNNGDKVEMFINSSGVIAVILVLFKNNEEMKVFSNEIDEHIKVIVNDF
jgi:biotin carboxylase